MADFLKSFAAGGISGAVAKTCTAPIERVKLIIQTQDANPKIISGEVPRYTGIGNCFTRVASEQGVSAFWRGNFVNILRYFPTQAFNFAFKDSIKAMFPKYEAGAAKFLVNIASGGLAGAGSLTIIYPLDYARTRLANDSKSAKGGGERQFNGLIDVYRKTLASDGIAGLYRGFVVSCVGIVVYRGCYFGFFDSLKPLLPAGTENNFLVTFALGWVVTIASGLASYPLDTIRRRMMMTSGEAVKYKSSIDCAVQVMKNEGFASFFKGAGANVLRGVAGAGVLAGFDKVKEYYMAYRFADEE